MNAKNTLLQKIRDGSFALLTEDEIAKKLHLKGKAAFAVGDLLRSLAREGEIYCDMRGRYGTAEQFGAIRGTISGNERGFGFFVPDDPELEDLFILTALCAALTTRTLCSPSKSADAVTTREKSLPS